MGSNPVRVTNEKLKNFYSSFFVVQNKKIVYNLYMIGKVYEMKDKKVTSLILVLVLAIGIIASGTFAYWQWITSTAQETLVNVSLTDDATIYIDFPSEDITHMYPTSDCEVNGTSSWVTDITVNNGTGVLMATNFKLKVKIEDKDGNVITNSTNEWNTNPFRYYIKYAVTEENESC